MTRTVRAVTIAGARPQFVKAFALSRALSAAPDFEEILIHTGQHFDENMSAVFFEELGIPQPKYHFRIEGGGGKAALPQMLRNVGEAIAREAPDAVIVYGDTDSTLAGALAATRARIPLVHIEAGMRSFNRRMPEEANRTVADHLSNILFCVTRTSVENLAYEGLDRNVFLVGDLMYDATLLATDIAERRSAILQKLKLRPQTYAVATVHRAGNTDEADILNKILDFIAEEARKQPVVFPIHPRTARAAVEAGIDVARTGAIVIEPLGYLAMCRLVHNAALVLTDSGGLQKEAYFHRVPCITLREETEWVETIECGWNRLWTEPYYRERREIADFGDGHSAERIVEHLRSEL